MPVADSSARSSLDLARLNLAMPGTAGAYRVNRAINGQAFSRPASNRMQSKRCTMPSQGSGASLPASNVVLFDGGSGEKANGVPGREHLIEKE